jgi:hypothetical protein
MLGYGGIKKMLKMLRAEEVLVYSLHIVEMYNVLNFTTMKNTSICIFSALGGALVGAAVAMLFTPQSGKELRHRIQDAIDDTTRRIHDDLCRCKPSGNGAEMRE